MISLLFGLVITFTVTPVLVFVAYTPIACMLDRVRNLEDLIAATWATRHTAKCTGCKRCLLVLV